MNVILQALAAILFIAVLNYLLRPKENEAQGKSPHVEQIPADAAAAALASKLGIPSTLPRRVLTLVARGTVLEANNTTAADAVATFKLLTQVFGTSSVAIVV
jgi:hypothetical protein